MAAARTLANLPWLKPGETNMREFIAAALIAAVFIGAAVWVS